MRYVLGLGLCVLVACDSGSPAGREKAGQTKEDRAARAARELDDQLIAPPADVVSALGADVYPGARMLKGFAAMHSDVGDRSTVDYVFFSTDPAVKIRDFYASKLSAVQPADPAFEKMGAYVVKGTNANGDEVAVQARGLGAKTTVHFVVTKKK